MSTPEESNETVDDLARAALEVAIAKMRELGVESPDGSQLLITDEHIGEAVSAVLDAMGIEHYVVGLFTEPCEHGCPHGTVFSAGMSHQEVASFGALLRDQAAEAMSAEGTGVIDSSRGERDEH